MNKFGWFVIGAIAGGVGTKFFIDHKEQFEAENSPSKILFDIWNDKENGDGFGKGSDDEVTENDFRRDTNRSGSSADRIRVSDIIRSEKYRSDYKDVSSSSSKDSDTLDQDSKPQSAHLVRGDLSEKITINELDTVEDEKTRQNGSQSLSGVSGEGVEDNEIPENVILSRNDDDLENFVPVTAEVFEQKRNEGAVCLSFAYDDTRDLFFQKNGVVWNYNDPFTPEEMYAMIGLPNTVYIRELGRTNHWMDPKYFHSVANDYYIVVGHQHVNPENE